MTKDKKYQKIITKMRTANKLIFEIEMAMAGTTPGAMMGIRYLNPDMASLATGIKIKADNINDIVNAKPPENPLWETRLMRSTKPRS